MKCKAGRRRRQVKKKAPRLQLYFANARCNDELVPNDVQICHDDDVHIILLGREVERQTRPQGSCVDRHCRRGGARG
jgi:transcription elongation factor Elf1